MLTRLEVWKKMQNLEVFTLKDLPGNKNFVKRYVKALEKAKFIEQNEGEFRLIKNTGAQAPVVQRDGNVIDRNHNATHQTRIWKTMRILKSFSVEDLVLCTKAPNPSLCLSCLCRAGYIQCKYIGGKKRRGKAIYRLLKDTGPLAPILSEKNTKLFDPNTNTHYPIRKEMTEASHA